MLILPPPVHISPIRTRDHGSGSGLDIKNLKALFDTACELQLVSSEEASVQADLVQQKSKGYVG